MIRLLFPHICVLCHNASHSIHDLCDTCFDHFPIIPHACVRCATPLSTDKTPLTCGLCLTKPPSFDIIHTLYHYEQPVTRLILDLKFNHTLIYAALVGRLMLEHVQSTWYRSKPLPDILMPMPLHAARLKERGFNQALEIARPLAKTLKIALEIEMSRRIKPTLPQATLSAMRKTRPLHSLEESAFRSQPRKP